MHSRFPLVTCWVALVDVSAENGTLEYVKGSHKWTVRHEINISSFHAPNHDYQASMKYAASTAGVKAEVIPSLLHKAIMPAGSIVFHHGAIWHGSGQNFTRDFRRSIGIHLIPSDAQFDEKRPAGYIFGRYAKLGSLEMDEVHMLRDILQSFTPFSPQLCIH